MWCKGSADGFVAGGGSRLLEIGTLVVVVVLVVVGSCAAMEGMIRSSADPH